MVFVSTVMLTLVSSIAYVAVILAGRARDALQSLE